MVTSGVIATSLQQTGPAISKNGSASQDGQKPNKSPLRLPRRAADKLEEAFHRVVHPTTALYYWERVLTDKQREILSGDLATCYKESEHGTIGMYRRLYEVSIPRAVVALARATDQMSETDYRWLNAELFKVDPIAFHSNRNASEMEVPTGEAAERSGTCALGTSACDRRRERLLDCLF